MRIVKSLLQYLPWISTPKSDNLIRTARIAVTRENKSDIICEGLKVQFDLSHKPNIVKLSVLEAAMGPRPLERLPAVEVGDAEEQLPDMLGKVSLRWVAWQERMQKPKIFPQAQYISSDFYVLQECTTDFVIGRDTIKQWRLLEKNPGRSLNTSTGGLRPSSPVCAPEPDRQAAHAQQQKLREEEHVQIELDRLQRRAATSCGD